MTVSIGRLAETEAIFREVDGRIRELVERFDWKSRARGAERIALYSDQADALAELVKEMLRDVLDLDLLVVRNNRGKRDTKG